MIFALYTCLCLCGEEVKHVMTGVESPCLDAQPPNLRHLVTLYHIQHSQHTGVVCVQAGTGQGI